MQLISNVQSSDVFIPVATAVEGNVVVTLGIVTTEDTEDVIDRILLVQYAAYLKICRSLTYSYPWLPQ